MAQYDSADLLARVREALKLPALDQPQVDQLIYRALEEAQVHWMSQLAAFVPETNYGAPELLTSNDGGFTYQLSAEPLGGHMELRASRDGPVLLGSTDWGSGDFVLDGNQIRIPGGRSRTFTGGPYARYVKAPGLLDGSNPPVLKPNYLRLLLVYRAAAIYAEHSEGRNPEPYLAREEKLWSGGNDPANVGFLGQLKTQHFSAGVAAVNDPGIPWWRNNPDLG